MASQHLSINRRRFLAVVGGAAASAILAACGGETAPTATPQASAATGAASTPTAAAGVAPTTGATASSTGAASSAAATARPAGTVAGTTASGTGASGTAIAGSAVTGTRPASSAVSGTTAAGSAASGTTSAGTTGQTLVIEATEYAFKTMGSIPAGITTVQMRNLGKEHHEAQLVRLNDGVTFDQLLKAIQQEGEPPDIFTFEGGPAEAPPNKTPEVMLDLKEGQYAILCFIDAPDKQPHAAKGMVLQLKVTSAAGAAGTLPAGKGTLALGAPSGFELPATLPAGKSTYRVTNGGKAPHALFYGSIPADKTIDDVNKALADPDAPPPPWFTAQGGMDGLKPGGSGAVILDLAPGKYAIVDVVYGDEKPFGKIFTVS